MDAVFVVAVVVIDFIHDRLKVWGAQQRWLLFGKDGWPSRTMLGRIMEEGLLGASAGSLIHNSPEVLTEDAVLTNNAFKLLPEKHRMMIFVHYVIKGSSKTKAMRLNLSKSIYYERIDSSHGAMAHALHLLSGQNRPKQSGNSVGQYTTLLP